MELYKKYAPKSLKSLVGQEAVKNQLVSKLKADDVPHSILLTGPSGTGKTTVARVIKNALKCSDMDYNEQNTADTNGIDQVRDIRNKISMSPADGECRIWFIDECHQLSTPAQNAFLKLLEDPPRHVYFLLATTNPEKLIKPFRDRCFPLKFTSLQKPDLERLLNRVCSKEEISLEEDVKRLLIENADGSARKLLVDLESIAKEEDEERRLQILRQAADATPAIRLAQALLNGEGWGSVSSILRELQEEPESIRHMVLSYCNSVMLGVKTPQPKRKQAYKIANAFRDNFYDSKKTGLTMAAFEAVFMELA